MRIFRALVVVVAFVLAACPEPPVLTPDQGQVIDTGTDTGSGDGAVVDSTTHDVPNQEVAIPPDTPASPDVSSDTPATPDSAADAPTNDTFTPECVSDQDCAGTFADDACATVSCVDFSCVQTDLVGEYLSGGAGSDRWTAAHVTTAGEVLVAGVTTSKGAGGFDAWIAHADGGGALRWEQTRGDVGNDIATAVTTADDGTVVVGGAAPQGGFLAAHGPDGAPLWRVEAGHAVSSLVTFDGAVWAGGWEGTTPTLWRVDPTDGSFLDTLPLGVQGRIHAIAAVTSGEIWVAGFSGAAGATSPWLAQVSNGGVALTAETGALPGDIHALYLDEDLDRAVVAGHGADGAFVAAFARTDGVLSWQRRVGPDGGQGLAITGTDDYGYAFGGVTAPGQGFYGQLRREGGLLWEKAGPAVHALAVLSNPHRVVAIGATGDLASWTAVDGFGGDTCSATSACFTLTPGDCLAGTDACQSVSCDATTGCQTEALACDDGNPCTADGCDPATGCDNTPAPTGTECDDGDACTTGDACDAGVCVAGAPLACDDDGPCRTSEGCVEGACVYTNLTGPCDDGDACTEEGTCEDGSCATGPPKACDDGVACTQDSCDPSTGDCVFAADDGLCDDGSVCTIDTCDAATGCSNDGASLEGTACNAATLCATPGTCQSGICDGSVAVDCDDNDVCTDDSCDPATGGCITTHNTAPCDDGDFCTVGETCAAGSCQGGVANTCDDNDACTIDVCAGNACDNSAAVDCADGDPCTQDNCEPSSGCDNSLPEPNGTACDDGDACTDNDACTDGVCAGVGCDDGIDCTTDSCVAGVGCENVPSDAACQDGNDCTINTCNATAGCVGSFVADDTDCDDGDACTVGEVCTLGICGGGTPNACDDGDPCTSDGCDPIAGGCVYGNKAWANTGASGARGFSGLHLLIGGGAVAVGQSVGPSPNGSIVRAYDTSGTETLASDVNAGDAYFAQAVVGDGDDGFVVLYNANTASDQGVVLQWYAADGTPGSSVLLGGASTFFGVRLIRRLSGGYVVAGGGVGSNEDIWVAAVDGSGAVQWSQTYPTTDSERSARGLVELPSGELVVAAKMTDLTASRDNIALLKLDGGDGAIIDERLLDISVSDEASDAILAANGDIYVTGRTSAFDSSQGLLVRLDTDLGVRWHRRYRQPDNAPHTLTAITPLSYGGFAIAGMRTLATGNVQAWLASIDDQGMVRWDRVWGGADDEFIANLREDATGSLWVAGWVAGTGGTNEWIARLTEWGRTSCSATSVCNTTPPSSCSAGSCTSGDCDQSVGCIQDDQDWHPCEADGNPCTPFEFCDSGVCQQAPTTTSCSQDDNVCTTTVCHGSNGCVDTDAVGPCNDGDTCTAGDVCTGGVCAGVSACDDGIDCTLDTCDLGAPTGCVNTPDDTLCDDGNPCTVGTCDAGAGCNYLPDQDNQPCDDANGCTDNTVCSGGQCGGGTTTTCADGSECTTDACDPFVGDCVFAPVGWETVTPENPNGRYESFVVGADGSIVVVGRRASPTTGPLGLSLRRHDASGAITVNSGIDGQLEPSNLVSDGAGGFVLVTSQTVFGGSVQFLSTMRWFDAALTETNSMVFGTPTELPIRLLPLDGGGYAVLSQAGFGNPSRIHVAVITSDGSEVWSRLLDEGSTDNPGSFVQLSNGNLAITGTRSGSLLLMLVDVGDGSLLRQRTIDWVGVDQGFALAETSDGGLLVGGSTAPVPDALLVKVDAELQVQWHQTFGGAGLDRINSMAPLADGGFVIGGERDSNGGDGWIASLDSAGKIRWERTVGGDFPDGIRWVTQGADGSLYAAGFDSVTGPPDIEERSLLTRMTPWGRIDCAEGSPCNTLAVADCAIGECGFATCDDVSGCTPLTKADGAPCNDGAACSTGDSCLAGTCTSGAGSLNCGDDVNVCTDDLCSQPDGGCIPSFNTASCDDGDGCTSGTTCFEGDCEGGTAVDCDDGDDCTLDACDPATGQCSNVLTEGLACDDGDSCTSNDVCDAAGQCAGASSGGGLSWAGYVEDQEPPLDSPGELGISVAVDGDWMVVGQPGASTQSGSLANVGAALIYRKESGTWTYQTTLIPSYEAANSFFGAAVDIEDQGFGVVHVVVGAPGSDLSGVANSGAVFIFLHDPDSGMNWVDQVELSPDHPSDGGEFGAAVAIDDGSVFVGEPKADANYDGDNGIVHQLDAYLMGYTMVGWFGASDPSTGFFKNTFGAALAIDNDLLVVGAPGRDFNTGGAYVFGPSLDATWEEKAILGAQTMDPLIVSQSALGTSVATDGTRIAVGAPFASFAGGPQTGAVLIFEGAPWAEIGRVEGTETNGQFGMSVAVAGDTLFVGAPNQEDSTSAETGLIHILTQSGGGGPFGPSWTGPTIESPFGVGSTTEGLFGFSCAYDAGTLVVGAPAEDISDNGDGGSYHYEVCP